MFGERLKALRESYPMTQEELASQLNIGHLQIYRYEKNKTVQNAEILAKIAQVFSVSTDYLVGLTDNPASSSKLNDREMKVVSAMRHNDAVGAIKVIVSEE